MNHSIEHGGNLGALARQAGASKEEILDFSASINPLGPPECLRQVISRNVERLAHYPDPYAEELAQALAAKDHLPPEAIVLGNGSTEIFHALTRALQWRCAVIPVPSYGDYVQAASRAGMRVERFRLKAARDFALDWSRLDASLSGGEIVFLGQPNNPTALMFDRDQFLQFAADHPATVFVVDEAFADFIEGYATLGNCLGPNVIVVRSLTKFYAIPGLRLGYAIAPIELAERIRGEIPAWSVNALAQAVGIALLQEDSYATRTRALVTNQREVLTQALGGIPGLHVFPSQTNFLLVRIDDGKWHAQVLADALLKHRIAIRVCTNFEGLGDRYFRIAVRTEQENGRLIEALELLLKPAAPKPIKRKRTPALMIQGTSSSAGKSVLTAAFCRILLQDGVRVAPFKSQNMSLNSFVTRDGGEMGRAQVVQAQACRLEPDVRMNPILLKPNSQTGCQVIVRGKAVGNMRVGEYVRYKPQAFEIARHCYDGLARDFDAIILEGAGSPAEMNLKSHDIVNMAMARHAESPVLVVGDIDRGGVFASFIGTMETMASWERSLVAGWLVNRFRGDATLLGPALEYTLNYTGRPVLGVIPYLDKLNLPQEDSVNFKSGELDSMAPKGESVQIAIIDLPHISNFTDFDAFAVEPDVQLRIVRSFDELGSPDALIIPGSKNTVADLRYLQTSGIAERIAKIAADGITEIVGICGGFQILGGEITDPHSIETSEGSVRGLGLLEIRTVLAAEKTLTRATARHLASGLELQGYEIHHGQSPVEQSQCAFTRADGQPLGAATANHRVWGTYLHGVFDSNPFRRWFIDRLRVRRGLVPTGALSAYDIEPALDRLAAIVRESVQMKTIYQLMGL